MKIIGHRGARGLAPENTIAALQKGLAHHVDELEFDLRVTKDGVVVLHHDRFLTDPNGKHLIIKKHTYPELKAHKPDLATFEEIFEFIGHPVILHIEVKFGEPVAPVIDLINKHLNAGWKPEYFLLGSKSQRTLRALHTALPEIQKVVIEPWSGVRATWRARQVATKRLSMNQLWLWRGFIRAMAHRGYQLGAYPVNDVQKAKRWADYGLHAIITDYPDRFEKP